MPDIIKVFFLGIVEGITEFLPISSTGHLILFHNLFTFTDESFSNAFDVIIQLGAILSVVVLYFEKLNPLSRNKSKKENMMTLRLWIMVVIAVLPAVVLGLLFDDIIDKYLFKNTIVATTLVFWGIGIILLEKNMKKDFRITNVNSMDVKTAFLIGCFQCLAMIPGTSRSAATIFAAMMLGTSRTAAAEFSFFLAIPTMLGATLLKIVKLGVSFTAGQWTLILFGTFIAFVTALAVIRLFIGYIKNRSFTAFGIYRIILGVMVFIFTFMKK